MSVSAILHPHVKQLSTHHENPLPQVLHTPAGLALLEMQGTINLPHRSPEDHSIMDQTLIGRLVFPGYSPDVTLNTWTKAVHMYVGQHQRLTGEVKILPKAIAIIRKKANSPSASQNSGNVEEMEIVEIVKFKIIFSQRPEPVGTWTGEESA